MSYGIGVRCKLGLSSNLQDQIPESVQLLRSDQIQKCLQIKISTAPPKNKSSSRINTKMQSFTLEYTPSFLEENARIMEWQECIKSTNQEKEADEKCKEVTNMLTKSLKIHFDY